MKQNIEIEIPEGFEAKYNPETQVIEIVEKIVCPKSWKEYCQMFSISDESRCYANSISEHLCPTREESEAFIALMKLVRLRNVWVGNWKPNYTKSRYGVYSIRVYNGETKFRILDESVTSPLTFPIFTMAKEFIDCFNDLLEKAKPLL